MNEEKNAYASTSAKKFKSLFVESLISLRGCLLRNRGTAYIFYSQIFSQNFQFSVNSMPILSFIRVPSILFFLRIIAPAMTKKKENNRQVCCLT